MLHRLWVLVRAKDIVIVHEHVPIIVDEELMVDVVVCRSTEANGAEEFIPGVRVYSL